jgi:hypothetical protein
MPLSALALARAPAPPHSASSETGVRASVLLHARARALRGFSAGRGNSIVVMVILTVGHRRRAGPRHGMCIVHDPARVLGLRSVTVPLWVREGGPLATSVGGMVAGAAQVRLPPLYARAAPGRGHPLGPGPDPVLGLGLLVVLVLVLARVPALGPVLCRTLRTPEAVVGPGRTAGAVEAIAGMTSGIADLARHTQKKCDDRRTQLTDAAFRHTFLKFTRHTVVVY